MDIFSIKSYREIIRAFLLHNAGARGYQKQLAAACGCQSSYLSQVLNSHVQLTPDQAAGLCDLWHFDQDESEYFLDLVHLERSSSQAHRDILNRKLSQLREKRMRISERLSGTTVISHGHAQVEFYSAWYYAAVHNLILIKGFSTIEKIARRLKLDESLVRDVLMRIADMGLAQKTGETWSTSGVNNHLPSTSPLVVPYHSNWRHRGIEKIQERKQENLHYTGLYSVNRKDFFTLREELATAIERSREVALASQDEDDLVCFSCDLFFV